MIKKISKNDDHVGAPIPDVPPVIYNQVWDRVSMTDASGAARCESHREDPKYRLHQPNGLRWNACTAEDRVFLTNLFVGIEDPRLCEEWYLRCYMAMRDRGIWPTDIAAEQRLSDELRVVMTPPTPAGIQ